MFILKYAPDDTRGALIKERFREMRLGFKTEVDHIWRKPTLYDDDELLVEGGQLIHAHLDELQGELHQWYYCNC